MARISAILEDARTALHFIVRRPDFDGRAVSIEEVRAEVERTLSGAVAGADRLAVHDFHFRADLGRRGRADGVVEVAREAPTVRKRNGRRRDCRAEVEVETMDVGWRRRTENAVPAHAGAVDARGDADVDLPLDLRGITTTRG